MTWPVLGAIRFFLALIVAGSHVTLFMKPGTQPPTISHFSGVAAVFAFLVISGYSIAESYSRQPKDFYFRRLLRIMPLYAILLVVSAVTPALFGGDITLPGGKIFTSPTWSEVLGNMFFLQGFLVPPIHTNQVLWTLSVEVFYYLATPLLAKLSQRVLLCGSCLLALTYAASSLLDTPFYSDLLFGVNVLLIGWPWLLGFWARNNNSHKYTAAVVLGIGLCAIGLNNSFLRVLWPITWTVTIIGIGYACYIPYNRRIAQAFLLLGDASYPLYLAHMPVFTVLFALGFLGSTYTFLPVAIVFSILLDRMLDRPLKRLVRTRLSGKASSST